MDNNEFIVVNNDMYLDTQSKSLEERINEINLDKDKECEIKKEKGLDIVKDKFLGSFKLGAIASTIIGWSEEVNKEIKDAKKAVLLEQYINKIDKDRKSVV